MTLKEAIHILQVLIARDADCRCGNKELHDEEIKAIKLVIEEHEK